MPAVSAIITTRNRPELLARAVESVKHQTFKDIEIIVVDDASDNGPDPQASSDPDIRYIYIPKEESKGGNYARNVGIRSSNGDFLAFLDDDDFWIASKTEKQLMELKEKNGCFVYCRKVVEFIKDGKTHYYCLKPSQLDQGDMSHRVFYTAYCLTSMIMVSRETLFRIGLFDENLSFWQDHELFIRLAQATPFLYIDEPLCVYRKDLTDSLRLSNRFRKWKESVNIVHKKHRTLYHRLTLSEYLESRLLVWNDAYVRSNSSKMPLTNLYYRVVIKLFYTIPKKLFFR
jgi:glycosyltransferase involved in cell wall biosynthesis